jgi:hypothetical protein
MDFEELVEKITKLCNASAMNIMSDEDVQGVLEGGCGQFDDTFYMGQEDGEAKFANQILLLINEEMQP